MPSRLEPVVEVAILLIECRSRRQHGLAAGKAEGRGDGVGTLVTSNKASMIHYGAPCLPP